MCAISYIWRFHAVRVYRIETWCLRVAFLKPPGLPGPFSVTVILPSDMIIGSSTMNA